MGVDAGAGPDQPLNELGLDHLAVDVEIYARGHRAYAEYTNRSGSGVPSTAAAGPAGSSAEYWLLGLQLHFPPLHLRYNYSRADYRAAGFRERIHQPGVTLDLQGWLHALVEYDDWTRNRSGADPLRLDRSLNLVLLVDL